MHPDYQREQEEAARKWADDNRPKNVRTCEATYVLLLLVHYDPGGVPEDFARLRATRHNQKHNEPYAK
jgi:hypothetical protein